MPPQRVDVGLDDVDRLGGEESTDVEGVVGVLAGGDLDAAGETLTDVPQPLGIVGAHGLLEPGHAELGEHRCLAQRLLDGVGAVGVDVELDVGPDRLADGGDPCAVLVGVPAHLDLHARDRLVDPTAGLGGEDVHRVGGEPAAAVDRHLPARGAEQVDERDVEELRLEVPQRDVQGRDRVGGDAGAAEVAAGPDEVEPAGPDLQRILPDEEVRELPADERRRRRGRVAQAQAGVVAGVDLHRHHAGGVPREGPVALGPVGGDAVGRDVHPVDGVDVDGWRRWRWRWSRRQDVNFEITSWATSLAPFSAKPSVSGS